MTQKTYAEIIKALREKRAWSQEELAQIADVSPRTVQRVEAGEPCTKETLKALAAAFQMDVAEFTPDAAGNQFAAPSFKSHELMIRLQSGAEVFSLAGGVEAFGYVLDEAATTEQQSAAGQLLDFIRDWSDMWNELGPSERIRVTQDCSDQLKELEAFGLWVFGKKAPYPFVAGGKSIPLETVTIGVFRSDNTEIKKASSCAELFEHLLKDLEPTAA